MIIPRGSALLVGSSHRSANAVGWSLPIGPLPIGTAVGCVALGDSFQKEPDL